MIRRPGVSSRPRYQSEAVEARPPARNHLWYSPFGRAERNAPTRQVVLVVDEAYNRAVVERQSALGSPANRSWLICAAMLAWCTTAAGQASFRIVSYMSQWGPPL